MAGSAERSSHRHAKPPARRTLRPAHNPCALCRDKVEWVDYKDVPMLRKYMSDRGKIRSRRVTGNCAQHQRALAMAIKTARELVLLPYTQRTVTERPGGRRDRGDRGDRTLSDAVAGESRGPRRDDREREVAVEAVVIEDDGQGGDEAGLGDDVVEVVEVDEA